MPEWQVFSMFAGVAAVGAALYFLGSPLLILLSQTMEASPRILPFHPDVTPPPLDAEEFFEEADADLSACGFRRISAVVLPNPVPRVTSVLELFVHDRNLDNAMVVAIYGDAGHGPPLQARYVEFISEFDDHELKMLVTNNNAEVGVFKDFADSPTFRLPQLDNIEKLYAAHQVLVQRHARGAHKKLTVFDRFGGDVCKFIEVFVLRESYQRQVQAGVLRHDKPRKCFVPTFAGAYFMTWRLLWPIKQMLQNGYRSEGRRLEHELLSHLDWDDDD